MQGDIQAQAKELSAQLELARQERAKLFVEAENARQEREMLRQKLRQQQEWLDGDLIPGEGTLLCDSNCPVA